MCIMFIFSECDRLACLETYLDNDSTLVDNDLLDQFFLHRTGPQPEKRTTAQLLIALGAF